MKTKRADKRGHWPRGKRRNTDVGDWSRIRLDLSALLNDRWKQGVISASVLAATLGRSEKSVRRWIAGEDRPDPATQEAIRQWIADRRNRH